MHTINTSLAAVAMPLGLAILPFPGNAGCYGLHEPNAPERRSAYARDCETIRSLIDCGMQQRDAVAIVVDRRAMEGYMADLIAKCAAAKAKATAAPGSPRRGSPR